MYKCNLFTFTSRGFWSVFGGSHYCQATEKGAEGSLVSHLDSQNHPSGKKKKKNWAGLRLVPYGSLNCFRGHCCSDTTWTRAGTRREYNKDTTFTWKIKHQILNNTQYCLFKVSVHPEIKSSEALPLLNSLAYLNCVGAALLVVTYLHLFLHKVHLIVCHSNTSRRNWKSFM